MEDNSSEMGDTGLSGPSSRIDINKLESEDSEAVTFFNSDEPDLLQFSSMDFLKLYRVNEGLSSDGGGLERLISILQNKQIQYDTEISLSIFKEMDRVIRPSLCPDTEKLGEEKKTPGPTKTCMAAKLVAEHFHTLSVAIAGGFYFFDGEGVGRALKSLLRRALSVGRSLLEAGNELWFFQLGSSDMSNTGIFVRWVLEEEEKNTPLPPPRASTHSMTLRKRSKTENVGTPKREPRSPGPQSSIKRKTPKKELFRNTNATQLPKQMPADSPGVLRAVAVMNAQPEPSALSLHLQASSSEPSLHLQASASSLHLLASSSAPSLHL
uniref:Alanyl-tRNA synthetase class IIc N-terminal domain-containing protein n=1 Tax=Chromera velia CCMP2878 TaxID=1169474 RepID=A0A0G4GE67_9ALVE|eukprot:Cvel_641.t1-p1 / transcript=Cvel_641.t1 / gene=Cvel_641 / organism=Chromera_velia_CCMP2878 / gene_product=Alanine--tRNA ligase, putative / transcript_product=Alanine--tRNA ligase, putative / location=Cvel_scaffold19:174533-180183(-) / protein_length=323 / sequence_SO=supercontig / SO=protein_coding / is_pseudo=false